MRAIILFVLSLAVIQAAPNIPGRIVGGIQASINQYPFMTVLLYGIDSSTYVHFCGGTIITTRSILTAAHCTEEERIPRTRIRVGSTYAHSGGLVLDVESVVNHPEHNRPYLDNDVSVLRTASPIVYGETIQPAAIAGANYNLPDNSVVWPVGWGLTEHQGSPSEELRHAQVWIVNQEICTERYSAIGYGVTANMFCSGWLDQGGRGQCHGDSGGPVVHNGVVVGITSWGYLCAFGQHPNVNMRTSRFAAWIEAHAS